MAANLLKLNDDKTEAIICGTDVSLWKISITTIKVGASEITLSNTVRDLGLFIDNKLSMVPHISAMVKACSSHLRALGQLQPQLNRRTANTIRLNQFPLRTRLPVHFSTSGLLVALKMAGIPSTTEVWHKNIYLLPKVTTHDMEEFKQISATNNETASRAYTFHLEDYIHDFEVSSNDDTCAVRSRCHRSMRKNSPPHHVYVQFTKNGKPVQWSCSCAVGQGTCHHVVALLYRLEHYQRLNLKVVPPIVSQTSKPQTWHIPQRTDGLSSRRSQDVIVQRPAESHSQGLSSTLYNPSKEDFLNLPSLLLPYFESIEERDRPQFFQLWSSNRHHPLVKSNYGLVPKGCLLSYQQPYKEDLEENAAPPFKLPNLNFVFKDHVPLSGNKKIQFESLGVTEDEHLLFEKETRQQADSAKWHALRKCRITASNFKRICSRQQQFQALSDQLKSSRPIQTAAMKHGIVHEPAAAKFYSTVFKLPTYQVGFIINPSCPFVGCSPDRRVFDVKEPMPWGLLEIKCITHPNLEKCSFLCLDNSAGALRLKKNHGYYYQVQAQMGIIGSAWCDFFVKTTEDSIYHCERVYFDHDFFNSILKKVSFFL